MNPVQATSGVLAAGVVVPKDRIAIIWAKTWSAVLKNAGERSMDAARDGDLHPAMAAAGRSGGPRTRRVPCGLVIGKFW